MSFNADSNVGKMLDDPAASKVLLKYVPTLGDKGIQAKMARGLSLRKIASFPQAGITPEKLQSIENELAAL